MVMLGYIGNTPINVRGANRCDVRGLKIMASKDFKDIKIIDIDINRTKPSQTAPGYRHMYLKLSDKPTNEWINLFNRSHSIPRHTMWREAWIEGNYIVVDCVPKEIETHHLADLKQDIEKANNSYHDYLKKAEERAGYRKQQQSAEKEELEQLKKDLKDKL